MGSWEQEEPYSHLRVCARHSPHADSLSRLAGTTVLHKQHRTTEWQGLEGTSKDPLVQPPCQGREKMEEMTQSLFIYFSFSNIIKYLKVSS